MTVFASLDRVTGLVAVSLVVMASVGPCPACLAADSGETLVRLLSPEMRRLDTERQQLEQELRALPPAPAREVTGRLGHHSRYDETQDSVEWVDLDLGETHRIDAIVLVATPSDGDDAAGAGYGFPVRFRVEIAPEDRDGERTVVADHTREDFPDPGALPVYLPVPGLEARHVRITATRLARDGKRFFFSLGEIMVLSGCRNVASGKDRAAFGTSSSKNAVPMWGLVNLVDGHVACGPPVGTQASPTLGYQSRFGSFPAEPDPAPSWVQVDLGEILPIDEVRLFPARPPDFAHRSGFGFPPQATLELSATADFSTAWEVPGLRDRPELSPGFIVNPGDNVVTYAAGGKPARYVRFSAQQPFNANGQLGFALAEMQVWSGCRNVAFGKPVTSRDTSESGGWSQAALVDGFTSTANILDGPGWLRGLSRRRDVQHRLESITARTRELTRQWQRTGLTALGVGAAVAGVAGGAWFVGQRRARLREIESLRLRIAQDLHDEIGSSLGSIALIAQDSLADDTRVRDDLAEIKALADDTVSAMHDITRLIRSDRYGGDDLPILLRDTADRMLRGIPHSVRIGEHAEARQLSVDRRRDLVLMFKEALHNVTRHAAATDVEIRLARVDDALVLTVRDNGRGFTPAAAPGMGLANLHRRAEKHRGRVEIASAPHGTTLSITLPLNA